MAKFTQDLKGVQESQYTNMSKEPDRPRPNQGLGQLLSDIGGLVGDTSQALDQQVQDKIGKDLYEGVDPIRNEQGINTALATEGDLWGVNRQGERETYYSGEERHPLTRLNRPPNAEAMDRSLAQLVEARNQNKIDDTYYFTRLEALSRQVRARYPGYREVVDQKIQQITGVNPANALRREIVQQFQSQEAARQANANSFEKYTLQNQEYLPPDYYQRQQNGKPYDETFVYNYVAIQKQEEQRIKAGKAQLEYDATLGKATSGRAEEVAMMELDSGFNKLVSDTAMTQGFDQVQKKLLQQSSGGKPPTPEELQQMEGQMRNLEFTWSSKVDAVLSAPMKDGRSYASIVGPAKAKEIKDYAMARLNNMKEMLTNKEWGLLGMNTRITQQLRTEQGRQFMENPLLKRFTVARELGGENLAATMLMSQGVADQLTQAILGKQFLERSTGVEGGGAKSFSDQTKEIQKLGVRDKKQWQDHLGNAVRGIVDPSTTAAIRKNHIASIYGPGESQYLNLFEDTDRARVFVQLADPKVTAVIDSQADPQDQLMYRNWAKSNYSNILNTPAVRGLLSPKEGALVGVQYNAGTNRFEPVLTPAGEAAFKDPEQRRSTGLRAYMGSEGKPDLQRLISPNQKGLDMLNIATEVMDPILKKEGGVGPWVQGITNAMQGKPLEEKPGKQSGIDIDAKVQKSAYDDGSDFSLGKGTYFSEEAKAHAGLLDVITDKESGGDYNIVFGGGRANLSGMSIDDILEMQRQRKARIGSDAYPVGKYQIIESTLRGLKKEMGLSGSEPLTPELQDQMAMVLLKRRGLDDYKAGRLSKQQFLSNLADEWEAIRVNKGVQRRLLAVLGNNEA